MIPSNPQFSPAMNTIELSDEAIIDVQLTDELVKWELRIAQRADQLAAQAEHGRDKDLEYWQQAEREVLADLIMRPSKPVP
jgi:hypothetical protein